MSIRYAVSLLVLIFRQQPLLRTLSWHPAATPIPELATSASTSRSRPGWSANIWPTAEDHFEMPRVSNRDLRRRIERMPRAATPGRHACLRG